MVRFDDPVLLFCIRFILKDFKVQLIQHLEKIVLKWEV